MKTTISNDAIIKNLRYKLSSFRVQEIDYPLNYGESYYECTYSCGGCWSADNNATDSVKYKCPLCHEHTGIRVQTVYRNRKIEDMICFT